MAGTITGGRKAAAKNKASNPNFYAEIGSKGGSKRVPKGFALMTPEQRSEAGRRGGSKKRRVATSVNSNGQSGSTSNTQRTTTRLATSSSTSRNVKPSRRMSSFLGRLRKDWRG